MSKKNLKEKLKTAIQNAEVTAAPPKVVFTDQVKSYDRVSNDLNSALIGDGAFPFNQGVPGTAQLSQTNTIFVNLRYYFVSNSRQVVSQAYCEIDLVQTVVDIPVDDALRGGIDIKSKELDEDEIEEVQVSLDRDDDLNKIGQSSKWDRLFGGGGTLIMTDQDPMTPLNVEAIGPDTPLEFRAVDMWELFWDQQNVEGYDPTIQQENFEFYSYYGEKVHKSRVLPLKGKTAPSFVRPRFRGWGLSVLETLVRALNQYLKATDLAFEVLDEFKIDVFSMKNLVNTLMAPDGEVMVRKRVAMANAQKNYNNALVMDSEDSWDHKQLSFAGLGEAMEQIRMQVAAAMRMPITKLFGTSVSGGLGNTDQNDMENYNAMVESQIRAKIKPHILRIVELKCQKLFGFIPDDLSISFKPLRVLSAEQEENVKNAKYTRLKGMRDSGDITKFEFREAVNKGELLDITLDNAGDELNPSDPDIATLVEGDPLQEEPDPTMADGANMPETAKARPSDTGDDQQGNRSVNTIRNSLVKLGMKNSLAYDVAAYVVDGGDSQFEGRGEFFTDPQNVDKALWEKSRKASMAAFGKIKWQFVKWFYEKEGGTFHG